MKTIAAVLLLLAVSASAQQTLIRTQKPPLHGSHWMAVTGKPLAATAGAMIFQKGGNAVDAAAAMIAATCTMWDTLSWGGETQALIYDPHSKKVIGINALGVAPTGATPEFYKGKGFTHPPDEGVLAAVTPGHSGGINDHGGRIRPSVVEGHPRPGHRNGRRIRARSAIGDTMTAQGQAEELAVLEEGLSHSRRQSKAIPGPVAGEIFRQPDLAATLRKTRRRRAAGAQEGKSRKEAIYGGLRSLLQRRHRQRDRPWYA